MASQLKHSLPKKPTAWRAHQAAVLARTDLTTRDKFAFQVLASFAEYNTGTNCAPSLKEFAERAGKSLHWAARSIRRLKARAIVELIPLRSRTGRWKNNGYRFPGIGGPPKFDNLEWLRPSQSPRHVGHERDRATGRFVRLACGPKVSTGDGPKVSTGDATSGPKVSDQDPSAVQTLQVDPSASASAPSKPGDTSKSTTTVTPEHKTTAGVCAEPLWATMLDENDRRALRETLSGKE